MRLTKAHASHSLTSQGWSIPSTAVPAARLHAGMNMLLPAPYDTNPCCVARSSPCTAGKWQRLEIPALARLNHVFFQL